MESDFIPVSELAALTGYSKKVFYNSHCAQRGPLHEILVKLGGRLGCWRADYIEWRSLQRRLTTKDAA
jgi:predicted DNA-binding transcriptional regulator AlpA